MRAYSNALKAGVLGLAMLTAAPAFSNSAQAGPAPSVDIAALQQDPVHQAAMKASANKIVFVLGEGFESDLIDLLKSDLKEIGLQENNHFVIQSTPKGLKESGVVYIGGQILKQKGTNLPYVFDQFGATEAVLEIERLIKKGTITVATLAP
jgi:hypothetical protein